MKKLIEALIKASTAIFVLSFAALLLFAASLTERPKEARPATGQVVPFNVHGTTYYISQQDDRLFHLAEIAVAASLGFVILVVVIRSELFGPE